LNIKKSCIYLLVYLYILFQSRSKTRLYDAVATLEKFANGPEPGHFSAAAAAADIVVGCAD